MFKTDYLRSIGAFSEISVGDEFYLMTKAILAKETFTYSHHCYVKAYIHSGEEDGLSSGDRKITGENMLYENKKILRLFNRNRYPQDRLRPDLVAAVSGFCSFAETWQAPPAGA